MTSSSDNLEDDNDDDFEDDDEEDDELPDLGDWRNFRNNLSERGLDVTTDSSSSSSSAATPSSSSATTSPPPVSSSSTDNNDDIIPYPEKKKRPRSVSKRNEELLMKQNSILGKEYINDVWAHATPDAEVGGLVVRLPLEMQVYRSGSKTAAGSELQRILTSSSSSGEDDNDYDDNFNKYIKKDNNSSSVSSGADLSVSILAAKTVLWYRKARSFVRKSMEEIYASAENERIEVGSLEEDQIEFIKLMLGGQQHWQEVSLVLERNERTGSGVTLALNRPLAFSVDDTVARMVLYGTDPAEGVTITLTTDTIQAKRKEVDDFLSAFAEQCAVYIGGPDNMSEPAIIIHGISDLEGSVEIAPGSGIYRGGIPAAVDGVLRGTYRPLDFRFFLGQNKHGDGPVTGKGEEEIEEVISGGLDAGVDSQAYQPVACARSVALKQCMQLPKPLWHEVMELCGGELREVSRLEMMKRDDLEEGE